LISPHHHHQYSTVTAANRSGSFEQMVGCQR
jgi:hypothetical protein